MIEHSTHPPQPVETKMKRRRWEAEFLPPAIAIMETPSSPLPWMTAWMIIVIFCFALLWSYWGHIDIVAIAPGRVEPRGFSRVVQPLEAGRVAAIKVEEGSSVKAGQVLIELDKSEHYADLKKSVDDNKTARLTLARVQSEMDDDKGKSLKYFEGLDDIDPYLVKSERKHMMSDLEEQYAKLRGLDEQITEQRHNFSGLISTISTYETLLPSLRQRLQAMKELQTSGYASKTQVVDTLQKYSDAQINYEQNISRSRQITATIAALQERKKQTISEFQNKLIGEASAARLKISETEQLMSRSRFRIEQSTLKSPVDGMVFQLSINTVGGVVQPGQQLMTIVPQNAQLNVEAVIDTKDAGFVTEGQSAVVKIDAFPFTKYGFIEGKVTRVSRNSTSASNLTPNDQNQPQNQDQQNKRNYTVTIALDHTFVRDGDKQLNINPGMTASAEIKTGDRRVIEYFLSPLAAKFNEAGRER